MMGAKTTCGASAVLVASLLVASTALGNGRFPRAERLIESPSDPNRLYVAATYGILLTSDRGKNWYHVCENAFSFQDMYTGDPVLSLTEDESLLVGVQNGLNISHDHGCDWKQSLQSTPMPKQAFMDFTVAPTTGHPIVVVVSAYQPGGPVNQLEKSTDGGATWMNIGTPLPVAVVYTVDVDPTDARHIYATGVSDTNDTIPNTGVLLSSTDDGMTWTQSAIPNTSAAANPYIAAIHPTDPSKIFVRTDSWKNRSDVENADDALLYSSDGGKTWADLLHPGAMDDLSPGAKLFGFALSPDGSTALAGYGDPVVGAGRTVDPQWFGVYKSSSDGKYSFGADPANPTPMLVEQIGCITWTKTGVYVCATPQSVSSYVVFAKDANFTSTAMMTTLMTLNQTRGVPPNCSGRAVTTCDWNSACGRLEACNDGGVSTGATGGSSASAGSGGNAGNAGAGGAQGVGTAGAGGTTDKPNSCACRSPGAARTRGGQGAMWLLAAFLVRRRSSRIVQN